MLTRTIEHEPEEGNPYEKPMHYAAKVAPNGDVSPACAKRPRAIDLSRETWTLRREAVTCADCKRAMGARGR